VETLDALAERARELRVPPSMVIRAALGEEVVRAIAKVDELVLQGGGALRHVYGSQRFSADLDYVQPASLDPAKLRAELAAVSQRVETAWGECAVGATVDKGRLHRTKLRAAVRPGMTLVLAIEVYQVAARRPVLHTLADGVAVRVEAPEEIVADKVVASIDRLLARGMIKLRDAYDIDFLLLRGFRPDTALIEQKIADYGLAVGREALGDVAASLTIFAEEALIEQLRDVLPATEIERVDPRATLERVRRLFQELAR
jgi:predicted nucleotidyltransferase